MVLFLNYTYYIPVKEEYKGRRIEVHRGDTTRKTRITNPKSGSALTHSLGKE
jgi:hypothetical protein